MLNCIYKYARITVWICNKQEFLIGVIVRYSKIGNNFAKS